MGVFILNVKLIFLGKILILFFIFGLSYRLKDGKYSKSDTNVTHINCSESPESWLMATSK